MIRRLPLDKRLNWRDPNMPAWEDGFRSPEEIQKMAQRRLIGSLSESGERHFPSYKNDPSYWWSKNERK